MLALEGIEAGYGGHQVLRGVDLVVPERSVVALLGPNGVGKTTLLRVASGELRPTAGSIQLDGVPMTRAPSHRIARAGVCHVPEGRGVFPTLTVRDNLRLQAPRGDTEAIERAVTAFPRLRERFGQLAGTLSGGEQQMLALARAYVARPSVILVDEVSLGLAPAVIDEIFGHLRQLSEGGAALLIVEQYVRRALQLADYVYLMNKGRIVFVGESRELSEDDVETSYLGKGIQ